MRSGKYLSVMALLFLLAASASAADWSDNFNTGVLNASRWIIANEPAPGSIAGVNSGSFVPRNVDMSKGMLCLKLQQAKGSNGIISTGGLIYTAQTYGYGTYRWTMRASSTSSTPYGSGSAVSGQISTGFTYINNSQTEVDWEIEGQRKNTVWMTNWQTTSRKQYTSIVVNAPEAGFHRYKFIWKPGRIDFYVDGVLVSTHTQNIPSSPAHIMISHWGTNSTGWGGYATPGVQRYLYISNFSYWSSY